MSNGVDAGRDAGLIRSVDRAVAILDVLAVGGWKAGAEVARELGVHRSTALRLLATLERHRLVERDQRTAKYRLGGRLVQLASAVRGEADLRAVARPVCAALARQVGERLRDDEIEPDLIVTSPLVRAVQTAELVARGLKHRGVVEVVPALAPDGSVRRAAADLEARAGLVAAVGHEPAISALAAHLVGRGVTAFRKGQALLVDDGRVVYALDPESM